MFSLWTFILLVHLAGLALGVGCATAKVVLLLKCNNNTAFLPVYLKVVKPLTRILVLGLIMMTLSGITWLVMGYGLSNLMIVKLVFVAIVWILGLIIDKLTEPEFLRLAPAASEEPSPAFVSIKKKHLALEIIAAIVFYIIIVLGVLL